MRITRRYLQNLAEGEVINAVGAIQRNRNLKPRQRHQWSHVTVGPFPDHFKKAPVKKRTTLNTKKKKQVDEGEVVTGNFQRGKNQKKRLHHGSVVAGPGYKKPDPKTPTDKKPDWAGLGRAFGRSRPKSEETELDEKMITRRINPHKDESMDLIALTKKLLDAKTGELRKDVEVVKAEMAKIAEEKPVEKLDEKNWIAGAIKHPGALTRKAKRAGESDAEFEQKHKHDKGTTGKQARLGITLSKMHK